MTGHGVDVTGLVLSHGAGRPALRDVDLRLEPGEQVAVLGPSGAGKSTLLRSLLGAGSVVAGSVRVGGLDPFDAVARRDIRRSCGVVPQGTALVPTLTVRTTAVSGATHLIGWGGWMELALGRVPHRFSERVGSLCDKQGVTALLDRRLGSLSGGQQQRVALVRALLPSPQLLLADEPTTGLDPASAWTAVDALLAQRVTLVVATHDPAVATRFPRVLGVRDGRVVHDGGQPDAHQLQDLYGAAG